MTDPKLATDVSVGLTSTEAAERAASGRANIAPQAMNRSVAEIIRANVLTPVNAIMLLLFVLIVAAGFPQDGLFVGVVLSNSVIGVVQELRSRRALARLEVLAAHSTSVLRDGEMVEIAVADVVVDDVVELRSGDEVVVDGTVLSSIGLEVDESLLTGEADAVDKDPGDEVLSGSFASAGSGRYLATRVGADSYGNKLAGEARKFVLVNSELRHGINRILRMLTLIIPPASLLLYLSLRKVEDSWQQALQGAVAAAVAMVPDGLVLLTSLAFVAGIISLARKKALAKELATVELLARVDTLCLDKTGTITTGEIAFGRIHALGDETETSIGETLGAFAGADADPNPTMTAVSAAFGPTDGWDPVSVEPFSSARKWSAVQFAEQGTFFFGAPDVLLSEDDEQARMLVQEHSREGYRVLLLARSALDLGDRLPADAQPMAVLLFEDTLREDVGEILAFFAEQGVAIKVISGDNIDTVSAVAARAGVPGAERSMDARSLPDTTEGLAEALEQSTVFGRVTPHQKRAMVGALQSRGKVVAMTGDGVNDVLALKDADMGIAMGSGSAASRGAAELVLMDDRFATLPEVVAQGRRVINNIERVGNLFVTKATYAVLLTAIIGFQQVEFPFLPRHLTLIGTFSIGLPGIFLALAADESLVKPGFLRRVLSFSLPAGFVAAIGTWLAYLYARGPLDSPLEATNVRVLAEARTTATVTLLGIGLVILVVVSRPLKPWKVLLAATMAGLYGLVMVLRPLRDYFLLNLPGADSWLVSGIVVVIAGSCIVGLGQLLSIQRARSGS